MPTSQRATLLLGIRLAATLGASTALVGAAAAGAGSSAFPARPAGTDLVAFVRYPGEGGIGVVPASGGPRRDLTVRHGAPWYFSQGAPPVWSPDGKRIAFVDSRHVPRRHRCLTDDDFECPAEIYVIRPDGTGERQITQPGLGVTAPVWSPDARTLAYKRQDRLRLINADGSHGRRLTTIERPHYEGSPSWAPDGQSIALIVDDEIYVSDLRGSMQRISNTRGRRVGPIRTLTWAPSGTWIAFSAYEPYFRGLEQIFVIDRTGRTQRRLTRSHPDPYGMSWSPDGSRIAYGASGDAAEGGLFTVTVPTGRVRRLRPGPGLVNWRDPSWSPSGERLVATRSVSGDPQGCWVIDVSSRSTKRIVAKGHSCTWQPAR